MPKKTSRRGRLTTYDMPYNFTEEEKLQLGQELVGALEEVTATEAKAKKSAKHWKDEIDGAKGRVLQLRGKVRSGTEIRPVAARMIVNMVDGVREFYAVNGDDLLGTAPMRPGDEQLTINDLDEE